MMAEQLPLDLKRPDDWSLEAFLLGACNKTALEWVKRWPEWPQRTLALFGPAGCGKTHLCHIAAELSGAAMISFSDLGGHDWRSQRHVIIDGGRFAPSDEKLLFHVINWVREEGGSLLLAAAKPPSVWPVTLNDTRSRLGAIVTAEIAQPDDILVSQLIVKQFSDMGVIPSADVAKFIEKRIGRSFRAIGDAVYTVNQAALAEKSRITVPFIKRVMDW